MNVDPINDSRLVLKWYLLTMFMFARLEKTGKFLTLKRTGDL